MVRCERSWNVRCASDMPEMVRDTACTCCARSPTSDCNCAVRASSDPSPASRAPGVTNPPPSGARVAASPPRIAASASLISARSSRSSASEEFEGSLPENEAAAAATRGARGVCAFDRSDPPSRLSELAPATLR